jgi:hypothetical protein
MLQYEILRNLISSKSNMRAAGPNTLNCYTTIRSTPAYLTLKINTLRYDYSKVQSHKLMCSA